MTADEVRARDRLYYARNPERKKLISRQRYAKNSAAIKEARRIANLSEPEKEKARALNRAYYHRNKERQRARVNKNARLYKLKRYGLTIEQYDQILNEQNGLCAICRCPPGKKRLHVDHKHGTTVVRGILCDFCNRGLGMFYDNPDLLVKASEYLRRSQ